MHIHAFLNATSAINASEEEEAGGCYGTRYSRASEFWWHHPAMGITGERERAGAKKETCGVGREGGDRRWIGSWMSGWVSAGVVSAAVLKSGAHACSRRGLILASDFRPRR